MEQVAEENEWFEETWRHRDEVLYPEHVGGSTDGSISTVPYVAFEQLGVVQVDPRWLHCGALTFPPTSKRAAFTLLTSGLSNAWDDDEPDAAGISGLGIELRLDNETDAHWMKDVLLRLSAMQLLIGAGRFPGARILGRGDRVSVGSETFESGSEMTALLATDVTRFQLASGSFDLLQLFAISEAEKDFAVARGADSLVELLRQKTKYPINDIARRSVV